MFDFIKNIFSGIPNFFGLQKIIEILYYITIIILIVLILINLYKIVKSLIQKIPKKEKQNVKNDLSSSWLTATNYFEDIHESLSDRSWVFIIGEKGSNYVSFHKCLETDGGFINPQTLSIGDINCEIFLTDQSVVIEASNDLFEFNKEWMTLFEMIAEYRQEISPFDSIVINIPSQFMLEESPFTKKSRYLRKSLEDYSRRFNVILPIYILFSELDAIYGFDTFVEVCNNPYEKFKFDSSQINGWDPGSNDLNKNVFKEAFQTIHYQISQWVMRLQTSINDRDTGFRVYAFQNEFSQMGKKLTHMLDEFFNSPKKLTGILFRGFYFSGVSGDKLTSCFLTGLFCKISKEKNLIEPSQEAKDNQINKKSLFMFLIVGLLCILFFVIVDKNNFKEQIAPCIDTIENEVKPSINQIDFTDDPVHTINKLCDCEKQIDDELYIFDFFILDDIRNIQRKFMLNNLFLPQILPSDNHLHELNSPQEKTLLINFLKQNIKLTKGKFFSDFTELLSPEKKQPVVNLKKIICDKKFGIPEFDMVNFVVQIRLGLEVLFKHWDNVKKDLNDYSEKIKRLEGSYNDELESKKLNLEKLSLIIEKFLNIEKNEVSNELTENCKYDDLIKIINTDKINEPLSCVQNTLERHSKICNELKKRKNTIDDETQYIWKEKSKDLNIIKKILTSVKEKKSELLKKTPHDINKDEKAFLAKIEEKVSQISSTQWKKDQLHKILKDEIHELYNRLQDKQHKREVNRLKKELTSQKNDSSKKKTRRKKNSVIYSLAPTEHSNIDTPDSYQKKQDTMKPDFLIKKIQEINDLPQNELTDELKPLISVKYNEFISFWYNELAAFNPADSILEKKDWDDFRSTVIQMNAKFINKNEALLNKFFENVTLSNINDLKSLVTVPIDDSIKKKEDIVVAFLKRYGDSTFYGMLEKAQSDFLNKVTSLKKNYSLEAKNELKIFSQFINNLHVPEKRLHGITKNLKTIESHGIQLLQDHTKNNLREAFNEFVDYWKDRVDDFPFESKKNIFSYPIQISSSFIQTMSLSVMYTFFFDKENGLETLLKKVGNNLTQILNLKENNFLNNCNNWKAFLFNDQKKPNVLKVKFELESKERDDNLLFAGERFTKITLKELFENSEFRMSGEEKEHKAYLNMEEVKSITFRAYKESNISHQNDRWWASDNNKQNQYIKPSVYTLEGGDLFLMAFCKQQGNCSESDLQYKKESICLIQLNMSDIDELSTQKVAVFFSIKWNNALPDYIVWP